MKMLYNSLVVTSTALIFVACPACHEQATPSSESIAQLKLKRGVLISCGAGDSQFGMVDFETDCSPAVRDDFNLGMELLHSFEYDEAEKIFAGIIDADPGCAMAYWGVAMSNFHPLWTPPTIEELHKGAKAIEIGKKLTAAGERDRAYLEAIAAYYDDWDEKDHLTRCRLFENAMAQLHIQYPMDTEAALFYALALNAAAAPTDKTYNKQRKGAEILKGLYPSQPDHPGILHYLIHAYDYPELAVEALPAARRYAKVAPSSAHALHMPSHIFTRLGLWDEAIRSNQASVAAAKCYADGAGIKGHWDEELHGLDYLVYAYLQKGATDSARILSDYLQDISEVYPVNFKVAYAFAAVPARIALETRNWNTAATLDLYPANFPWKKFPWQEAITHFGRFMGAVHLQKIPDAKKELAVLRVLKDSLVGKDNYQAGQVEIQVKACEAWLQHLLHDDAAAKRLMNEAADLEDSTGKHPVTPCEIIPARELLGDLLLDMKEYKSALVAYEKNLAKNPNRLNGLRGAAEAAVKSGEHRSAARYQEQFRKLTASSAARI